MVKKLLKMEQNLIKKYTEKTILEYKCKYDDAMDLIILGSEVEDKKGLEVA